MEIEVYLKILSWYPSPSINPPIIPTFRDIANLIECMAMFYFIKGLLVFRIITEPCTDRFLLLSDLDVAMMHHTGRRNCTQSNRERQAQREESERGMAAGFRKRGFGEDLQGFFIHLTREI